jgi:hypothetical protein
MGPIGCPETSATNYKSMLRNILEERRHHLYRGGSLKSIIQISYPFRESNPASARPWPSHYTEYAVPAPYWELDTELCMSYR